MANIFFSGSIETTSALVSNSNSLDTSNGHSESNTEQNEERSIDVVTNKKGLKSKSRPIKFFTCKLCRRRFVRLSYLNLHLKKIHNQEPKNYKCSYCNKSYATVSNRNRHESTIHLNSFPIACEATNHF